MPFKVKIKRKLSHAYILWIRCLSRRKFTGVLVSNWNPNIAFIRLQMQLFFEQDISQSNLQRNLKLPNFASAIDAMLAMHGIAITDSIFPPLLSGCSLNYCAVVTRIRSGNWITRYVQCRRRISSRQFYRLLLASYTRCKLNSTVWRNVALLYCFRIATPSVSFDEHIHSAFSIVLYHHSTIRDEAGFKRQMISRHGLFNQVYIN